MGYLYLFTSKGRKSEEEKREGKEGGREERGAGPNTLA